PMASQLVNPLYELRKRLFNFNQLDTINLPDEELEDHVIIVGFGRIGQFIAALLQRLDQEVVIIELDQRRMERAQEAGYAIVYGDATQLPVLEAVHLTASRLLLITTPAISVTQAVVTGVRRICPDLHIVARAEGLEHLQELHKMGVYEVIQPEF